MSSLQTSFTASSFGYSDPAPLTGLNRTTLGIELRRLLRNGRTSLFAIAMPAAFFLLFGVTSADAHTRTGSGNLSAFVMVSMALYGATLATTSGAATVSTERVTGWTRQLRLTSFTPLAYLLVRIVTSMTLSLASICAVYAVGAFSGKPSMPGYLWLVTGLSVWLGSVLFAVLGLFVGYLFAPENVVQALSLTLVLCSFAGGLFIPLDQMGQLFATVAKFTPLYGLSQLAHAPLTDHFHPWIPIANLLSWLIVFAAGATWRFRSATGRV